MTREMFVYPWDAYDEGLEVFISHLHEMKISRVSLASIYHHARILLPHNPVRKLLLHKGGSLYVPFDPESYGSMKPDQGTAVPASFVRELIRFRKAHPILATKAAVEERTLLSCGYPAFSSHSERAWFGSDDDQAGHVGLMYCGVEGGQETFLYAAFNAHWNPQTFALPHLPQGLVWETVLDTGEPDPDGQTKVSHKAFTLPGRTVRVLCSVPEPEKKEEPEDGADPAALLH